MRCEIAGGKKEQEVILNYKKYLEELFSFFDRKHNCITIKTISTTFKEDKMSSNKKELYEHPQNPL